MHLCDVFFPSCSSEWKVFWEQIKSDPKQATELVGEMIERLMNMLEPKPAPSGACCGTRFPPSYASTLLCFHSLAALVAGVSLESLANTLQFMTFFTDFSLTDARVKSRYRLPFLPSSPLVL